MKKQPFSNCKFSCPEIDKETNDLAEAMQWHHSQHCVHIECSGEDLGFLVYAGTCKKKSELPRFPDFGVVCFCIENDSYYISMPDNV